MSVMIAAEHLVLTPTLRENVTRSVEKATQALQGGRARVFLKRESPECFGVVIRVIHRGKEWVAHAESDAFYGALSEATERLGRMVREARERVNHRRHRYARGARHTA